MILQGDCLIQLKTLPENSVDAIVTDPPYGLSFMGKRWDYDVPSVDIWREVLRVLKPGGHVLSFGGTRTYHRMVVNMEDAGFEIRDQVAWNFGSGFPKSLDVYKALKKKGLACECENNGQLPNLRKENGQVEVLAQADQDCDLQLSVQRSASRTGMGETRPQGPQGMEQRDNRKLSEVDKGLGQSMLARRSDIQAEQGELHRTEVCPVSRESQRDGEKGRLHNGASSNNGNAPEPYSNENGSCAPQGPQHEKQSHFQSRTISQQSSTQTCRGCGKAQIKGFGTALKPAFEPICLARKPLSEKTVAENVLRWGCGAINVDESRIASDEKLTRPAVNGYNANSKYANENREDSNCTKNGEYSDRGSTNGRWPANVLFDEEAAQMLDEQSGNLDARGGRDNKGQSGGGTGNCYVMRKCDANVSKKVVRNDSGGASRFFYCAKSSKRERNAGLEGMPLRESQADLPQGGIEKGNRRNHLTQNFHPTVKPIKLMEYLIKLITPHGGVVLDPFMGSGSTGVAAKNLGFEFIGIELSEEYFEIAKKRIEAA